MVLNNGTVLEADVVIAGIGKYVLLDGGLILIVFISWIIAIYFLLKGKLPYWKRKKLCNKYTSELSNTWKTNNKMGRLSKIKLYTREKRTKRVRQRRFKKMWNKKISFLLSEISLCKLSFLNLLVKWDKIWILASANVWKYDLSCFKLHGLIYS